MTSRIAPSVDTVTPGRSTLWNGPAWVTTLSPPVVTWSGMGSRPGNTMVQPSVVAVAFSSYVTRTLSLPSAIDWMVHLPATDGAAFVSVFGASGVA